MLLQQSAGQPDPARAWKPNSDFVHCRAVV